MSKDSLLIYMGIHVILIFSLLNYCSYLVPRCFFVAMNKKLTKFLTTAVCYYSKRLHYAITHYS